MPTGPSVPQPWSEDLATALIEQHRGLRGPLLPVLRALQETFGAIDPRAVPIVAQMLNLSRAEVHGVVTFYRDFRSVPAAPTRVSVCRAEACQSMGAARLVGHAERRLGVGMGETTSDRSVTLDQVFCLGNCAMAPALTVNGTLYGRVDDDRFDSLVSAALAEPIPTPSSPRQRGSRSRFHTDDRVRPRRLRRPLGGRRPGGRGARGARQPSAGSRSSSCATAPAACCGWSRSSRS